MKGGDTKINRRETIDAVDLLYINSIAGVFITLLAASALVFGFETSPVSDYKTIWWWAVVTVTLLRLADFSYWRVKLRHNDYSPSWPYRRFLFGSIGSAILWCVYLFIISHQVEVIELAFTLIVIAAMAGGAASILAASKLAAISYSSILLIPGSAYLLLTGDGFLSVLGTLGIFFGFVMVFSANKSAISISDAISLKYHNLSLVEELQTEKNEIKRMNSELNRAYHQLNEINASLEEQVQERTQEVYRLSKLDPLTKLYNRTAFIIALEKLMNEQLNKNGTVAVLFIDLDGFKKVNDIFGHEIGDQVLMLVTQRLLAFREDGNICRWGGDEFVLALPGLNIEEAEERARLITESIENSIQFDSIVLTVGASIGIALAPKHSKNVKQLIQFADIAMYQQKNTLNSKAVVFSKELLETVKQQEHLRDGLRMAIERDELYVTYQPVIDPVSRQINSCEALLRWTFKGEPVSPDVFIPVAEQSSLILQIGEWVLRKACFDANQWPRDNNCSVSVNVSMVQLLDDEFLTILDNALEQSQLKPERLILEITESVFAENKQFVATLLSEIMRRRVRVSIDDFGTGYSSLSQLQSIPFHILKIDRTFVARLDEKGAAIVKAALFIASQLGCETVAEGIETERQAEALKNLGASYLQGFLFSKPLKNSQLHEFFYTFNENKQEC